MLRQGSGMSEISRVAIQILPILSMTPRSRREENITLDSQAHLQRRNTEIIINPKHLIHVTSFRKQCFIEPQLLFTIDNL